MALIDKLTAIADAIREKTGKSEEMTLDQMATEITEISIGDYAQLFKSVIDRTVIDISTDLITEIGDYGFKSCSSLQTIYFPKLTKLGCNVFEYCTCLTTANIPLIITIEANTFAHCEKLTTVVSQKLTTIGNFAFSGCTSLTTINFETVTRIGNNAFENCIKLSEVYLPLLEKIYSGAFSKCLDLERISFPSVLFIGDYAFYNCSNLITLIINNQEFCSLDGVDAFLGTPIESGIGFIYVPDDLVDSYKTATNWSTYANQIKPLSEYVE